METPTQKTELTTYETCTAEIKEALGSADIQRKDDALKRIEAFFQKRIAKKSSDDEKNGTGTVKRAIESSRTWKPFKREAKSDETSTSGSLIG